MLWNIPYLGCIADGQSAGNSSTNPANKQSPPGEKEIVNGSKHYVEDDRRCRRSRPVWSTHLFPRGEFSPFSFPLDRYPISDGVQAHPFPAFVLIVPNPQPKRPVFLSRDTDITVRQRYDDVSPLAGPSIQDLSLSTVVWSNDHWLRITEGRSIDECLEGNVSNRLQAWVEAEPDDSLFALDIRFPAITLTLAKTIMPLSSSHVYSIVTAQTRRSSTGSDSSSSPGLRSFASGDLKIGGSSRKGGAWDSESRGSSFSTEYSSVSSGGMSPGSYFAHAPIPYRVTAGGTSSSLAPLSSDGIKRHRRKVERPKETGYISVHADANEMWDLVEKTDWSTTWLGPRSGWTDFMDPILSICFQSKTQDSVWIGEDLQLI